MLAPPPDIEAGSRSEAPESRRPRGSSQSVFRSRTALQSEKRAEAVQLAPVQPLAGDDSTELESRQEPRLVRALEIVAPGTALREGIDNIINARTGALICIGADEDLSFLYSGGIKLDIDYTLAQLYQIAKMDGAIILSDNATKIRWANVQLMPDPTILSLETAPATAPRSASRSRPTYLSSPSGSGATWCRLPERS